MLVAVVALFVLLSTLVALASIVTMRGVLTQRLDDQLMSMASRSGEAAQDILAQAPNRPVPVDSRGAPIGTIIVVTQQGEPVRTAMVTGFGEQLALTEADVQAMVGVTEATPTTIQLDTFGGYRVASVPLGTTGELHLTIGIPLGEVDQTMLALSFVIATSGLVAAMLLSAIADTMIRRALRPLTSVVATTERISQLPLDTGEVQLTNRVPVDVPGTEVGRVGESVNRMLNHIESSLEARAQSERKVRQFVADASHELRTPLAAVKGYAEITRKHEASLSDDARMSLTRIEGAADRMSALVNDLLLLARLDEGREVERRDVDLSLLVVEAVADAQAAGPAHPIELELPAVPVEVSGDLLRLQQVIANLLANARVHTPEGTRIRVTLSEEGEDAVLTIADSGPGIPPELQARLFERFVRGDASRSRLAGSSGLGLAIVRAILAAHQGSIAVTSKPGETVFTVRLPLAA